MGIMPDCPEPGSIPAGAGEPLGLFPSRLIRRVYPRGCGGTDPIWRMMRQAEGLSPRVRGNRQAEGLAVVGIGSIPAGAGEPCL